jgi:hypothetical protein
MRNDDPLAVGGSHLWEGQITVETSKRWGVELTTTSDLCLIKDCGE